ncbi:MAG: sugar phosphate isomerase/epimerase family protein [Candidatus Thorarchaeota archaeon]
MFEPGASYFAHCPVPISSFASSISSLGLKFIEIQAEPPFRPADLEDTARRDLVDLMSSYDLDVRLHGPIYDARLCDLDDGQRLLSVQLAKDCVQLARDLGSDVLVIHPGKCPGDGGNGVWDTCRARFIESLKEISLLAGDLGVTVAVENKQRGGDRELIMYPDEHVQILDDMRDYGVMAVLDIGHAHTVGLDLVQYLDLVKEYLMEVHLHDNVGLRDEHRPLGQGTADIRGFMQSLMRAGYGGAITLELRSLGAISEALHYLGILPPISIL